MLPDSCAIASKFLRSRQPLKPRASTNRFCAQAARSRNGLSGVRAVITEPRRERFHCKTPGKRRRKRPVQPTPSLSYSLLPSLSLPYTICTVFRCICVHFASNISTGKTAPIFCPLEEWKSGQHALVLCPRKVSTVGRGFKEGKMPNSRANLPSNCHPLFVWFRWNGPSGLVQTWFQRQQPPIATTLLLFICLQS